MNNHRPAPSDTLALWFTAAGEAALRAEKCPVAGPDVVVLNTLFSGISRGTERLIFNGAVPPCEYDRMRAPLMEGDFPFPVKYGYATVGVVEDGPQALVGKTFFALAPHQQKQAVPLALTTEVPAGLPPRRAVMTANMETALNAVWDSGAGPGDSITIVGAGIVGLLIARICARLPGADVRVVDIAPERAGIVEALGCTFAGLEPVDRKQDIVFHTSSTPAGLAAALDAAGFEARVIEVSWYGDRSPPVPLGSAFHSQRLQMVSSQVGTVSAQRRPRWDYARRRAKAMALLADDALDALITEDVAFTDLPSAMPRLLAPGAPGLQTIVTY